MPGQAGLELKDRRRRSAAFLLKPSKEAAKAPDGAAEAAAIPVPTTYVVVPTKLAANDSSHSQLVCERLESFAVLVELPTSR